jgi:hypothetical protein|tara:strand:- start:3599 stop:3853 length:255 start_codon:yes stop_codon:yes gene_type:complete
MRFPLLQLYSMNRSQPLVKVGESDEWIQWMSCNLDGLPPEREPGSMTDHGRIPKGQWDDLPEVFIDTNGTEHRIEDIHMLKGSK